MSTTKLSTTKLSTTKLSTTKLSTTKLSTTKLAKIEGVTSQTIRRKIERRRKIESGHYDKIMQTSGGHYRIFINQQRKIGYARVSPGKQTSSIDTQKRLLLERYPDAEFISDVASAFNFKRNGLQTILESADYGKSHYEKRSAQRRKNNSVKKD